MPSNHTIHRHHHHFGWDNANAPALAVAPGDTVELETVDSSGGQLSPASTLADLASARLRQGEPGDRPRPRRRGGARRRAEGHDPVVSRRRAGAGPPTSRASGCSRTSSRSRHCISGNTTRRAWRLPPTGPGGRVPLKPFAGTIGLAPAEPGPAQHRPAAALRRQHGHPRPRRRRRALSAGRGRGRAVLGRRHPRRAGRRRGVRHGDREPDVGRRCASTSSRVRTCRRRASPRPGR